MRGCGCPSGRARSVGVSGAGGRGEGVGQGGQQVGAHARHAGAEVRHAAAACRARQQLQQLSVALQQKQLLEVELVQEPAELHLVRLHVDHVPVHALPQAHQLGMSLETLQTRPCGVFLVHVVLKVLLNLEHIELDPLCKPGVAQQVEVAPDVRTVGHPGKDPQQGLELGDGPLQLLGEAALVPAEEGARVLRQPHSLAPQVAEQSRKQSEGVQKIVLAGGGHQSL